jgi:MoxR-like ATPase
VFLIDEVDRADEAFEAFLLEFLQTYEVTVPELGTVRPEAGPPFAVLTSNRTRPLSDALRRRAVYHYAPLPDAAELRRILVLRTGGEELADEVAHLVVELRQLPLVRPPGPAEAIDFLQGMRLVTDRLTRPAILSGLGLIVKDPRDLEVVRAYLEGT